MSDIMASWNNNKLVNTFVIKKTPLASILSRSVSCSTMHVHAVIHNSVGNAFQFAHVPGLC
jgi:hypothetical protein